MAKAIPIVMDAGALSEAAHAHADDVSTPVPGPPPVWLTVADVAISEAEIAQEMQHHRADDPALAREQAASALVIRALLALECRRLGIRAQIEAGETEDEALARQLLEREVESPEPDAEAVRRYFEANRERLRQPDRVRASHILLAAAPADIEARAMARAHSEGLIGALQAEPGRFEEFAARHSACPSREQGGALGWIERGDTVPEFERQVFMLRTGLAGLAVETRYGYHVVRVDDIVRGAPLQWQQAAPRVKAYLEVQARQNAVQDYLRQLRERYPVEGWERIASAT